MFMSMLHGICKGVDSVINDIKTMYKLDDIRIRGDGRVIYLYPAFAIVPVIGISFQLREYAVFNEHNEVSLKVSF